MYWRLDAHYQPAKRDLRADKGGRAASVRQGDHADSRDRETACYGGRGYRQKGATKGRGEDEQGSGVLNRSWTQCSGIIC